MLRGARGKSGNLARPFVPLSLELRGQADLKSVARLEAAGVPNLLSGDALFSGLYLNELLMRLLPSEDAHPGLFELYEQACRCWPPAARCNRCCAALVAAAG